MGPSHSAVGGGRNLVEMVQNFLWGLRIHRRCIFQENIKIGEKSPKMTHPRVAVLSFLQLLTLTFDLINSRSLKLYYPYPKMYVLF